MTVPTDLLHWILAFLPILVLLVLMIRFRWRATEAAPVGVLTAAMIAVTAFRANIPLLATESVKGIWSALVVLIVIWPAILLYEVSNEADAFSVIRAGVRRLLPNELLRILGIGLCFVGFLIGITGFGVPVAVGAPLLVGIGMHPLYAAVVSLIGEAWGSTFGTLAVAWDAMRLAAGLDADPALLRQTALWAGALIWLWNLIVGLAMCWLYGRGRGIKKGLPAVAVISLVQGGGQLLFGQINQTIACFLPTCLSLVAVVLLGKTSLYREEWRLEESPIMDRSRMETHEESSGNGMSFVQAFLPYLVLTAITLIILLIPPVKSFLGRWTLGFALPETSTGYGYINAASEKYSPIAPLTHASLFLLISSLTGLWYYRRKGWIRRGNYRKVLLRSVSKTAPSGFSVIGFLIMSRIMSGSGQTAVLAAGMASALGGFYAALAPMVGLIGAFMTSSNMASNILFSEFQLTTARLLGVNIPAILGAQTAGGAIGTATCPGNIILGCTTAGIGGSEGDVLKKTLPLSLAAAALLGLAVLAATAL